VREKDPTMSAFRALTRWIPPRAPAFALALAIAVAPSPPAALAQPSTSGEAEAPPAPDELATVTVEAPAAIAAGAQDVLKVRAVIRDGWHVNANPPTLDYLVPTSVTLEVPAGLAKLAPRYPRGVTRRFAFAEEPLSVYEGTVTIEVPLAAAAGTASGTYEVKGTLRYQACNDQLCLAPVSKPFTATVTVTEGRPGAPDAAAPPAGTEAPGAGPAADSAAATPPPGAGDGRFQTGPPAGSPDGAGAAPVAENPIARLFREHGLLAFFSIFLLGLGLNLTPCVYPMMSVTLALFGAREEQRLLKRLPAALVYMMGIAITYSALGVVAAFTGTLFGAALQSPLVLIGIGVILGAMALSMFGLFEIQLPSSLLTRLSGSSATGLVGVFLSGVMVGLFAAPCVGPPIVALLAVVAQSGNPWFGFLSFFVLSIGLGLPYLILGTYTGLLQKLPRSGTWMVWVKKLFGVLLLAVALFYLSLAVKPGWSPWVVPAALIAGGLYLGFFAREAGTPRGFAWLQRAVGAAAILLGAWFIATAPRQAVAWETFTPERLAQAQAAGRPAILDFYADWCVPCHELDRATFTDPEVRRLAGRFAVFKVDLTQFDSPQAEALRRRFTVEGVPTVLFLDAGGNEVADTRVVGFLGPRPFAERVQKALAAGDPAR